MNSIRTSTAEPDQGRSRSLPSSLTASACARRRARRRLRRRRPGGTGPGGRRLRQPARQTPAKYDRLWDRVPARRSAGRSDVAECESGRTRTRSPSAASTAAPSCSCSRPGRRSPKSPGGDPIDYSYKTQAVVAVALKKRDGTGHWPVCG